MHRARRRGFSSHFHTLRPPGLSAVLCAAAGGGGGGAPSRAAPRDTPPPCPAGLLGTLAHLDLPLISWPLAGTLGLYDSTPTRGGKRHLPPGVHQAFNLPSHGFQQLTPAAPPLAGRRRGPRKQRFDRQRRRRFGRRCGGAALAPPAEVEARAVLSHPLACLGARRGLPGASQPGRPRGGAPGPYPPLLPLDGPRRGLCGTSLAKKRYDCSHSWSLPPFVI